MPFARTAFLLLILLATSVGEVRGAAKTVVYAASGPRLLQYDVNVAEATLTRRGVTALPENVQYAWPSGSRKYLYVAWSNGAGADHHGVSTFRIDAQSGKLEPVGRPVALAARPIHITTDIPGTHVLIAYSEPSGLTVYQVRADGSVGALVKQPAPLDTGIYAHQVRVDPSNRMVILVTRGNGPANGKPEDPGALKVFDYRDGILTKWQSIAPNGGYGFQPRHLDFHPSEPWVFVSLERQDKLELYKKLGDGTLANAPVFIKDSLLDPGKAIPTQWAGTVHVHPNGKFVYQANRAIGSIGNTPVVDTGGTNSIAVYSIDQKTGEPTLIQNADTHGMTPRTFALDGSARILVAANQSSYIARGDGNRIVPANLAVFRVRGDGKLDFVRTYDVETSGTRTLFWMGVVSVP